MLRRAKLFAGRVAFWAGWPLWLVILRGTERSRVMLVADGCVLLTRGTLSAGEWSLPGGGVHGNEDVAVGACREIHEELGIMLGAEQLQKLATEPARNSGIAYRAHLFVTKLEKRVKPTLGLEIADARWVPFEEVRDLRHDAATSRALELLGVC